MSITFDFRLTVLLVESLGEGTISATGVKMLALAGHGCRLISLWSVIGWDLIG